MSVWSRWHKKFSQKQQQLKMVKVMIGNFIKLRGRGGIDLSAKSLPNGEQKKHNLTSKQTPPSWMVKLSKKGRLGKKNQNGARKSNVFLNFSSGFHRESLRTFSCFWVSDNRYGNQNYRALLDCLKLLNFTLSFLCPWIGLDAASPEAQLTQMPAGDALLSLTSGRLQGPHQKNKGYKKTLSTLVFLHQFWH